MSDVHGRAVTDRQRAEMDRVTLLVESHLRAEGLDLDQVRVGTDDGSPAWSFVQGSALVRVYLRPGVGQGDLVYFQAVAPVVMAPDKEREAFFEYLLSANADILWSCAFAVRDGVVLVTADRTTLDLDMSEVAEMIESVASYADQFNDELVERFGAVRYADARRERGDHGR